MKELEERLTADHSLQVISATHEYIAKTLTELNDTTVGQADRVIELLSEHPDVMRVYDNIKGYPSSTCKIESAMS